MRKLLYGIIGCLLSIGQTACTSIDCPVNNVVRTVYTLHKGDLSTDTLKDSMYVATFRVDGSDSTILSSQGGITLFSLPIGYSNPEDTLYFIFKNGTYLAIDTVHIKKENIPHFESVDCSASFFHNITAVRSTHNAIDSITINNPSVTYDSETEHFHLYLKSHD